MIQYLLRLLKRFAVLIPGIIIAYFSVRDVFPFFNRRLPVAFAVFVTYVLGAYLLVPALIRVYRIFRPAKHLPLYCVTPDGFASDPLNIAIIGTRLELINVMEQSGWYVADPYILRHIVRYVLSIVYGWEYRTAPVSSLYLFGRKHDIAFELPSRSDPRHRHHVRFWATTYNSKAPLSSRSIHWHNRQAHITSDNLLWVGAASLDSGVGYIRHNLQFTHMIDPDTDQERELILASLRKQKLVKKTDVVKLGMPYRLINRVFRGYLHTDGRMAVVHLLRSKN